MAYYPPSRAARRWLLALGPLLGLAGAARAQTYNTGPAYNTGTLYHSGAFTNAAGAGFVNTGSAAVAYYAGSTFTNAGSYAASAGATDQFVGPAGAAGLQTLAGTTAPAFANLTVANGAGQVFAVTNPAGADVANILTLNNGQTTTTNAVAGAIRLGSAATVAGTLGAAGAYVDGYVAKAGPTAFTYPLGTTNTAGNGGNTTAVGTLIYSPITLSNPGGTTLRYATGTPANVTALATQAAPYQLTNVSRREYYPMGTPGAPASSTITMPYGNFGLTPAGAPYVGQPGALTIAAYDGTRWINLNTVGSNAINTTDRTVTVTLAAPLAAGYSALALASTSPQNPLPVELTDFTAQKQQADGLLQWHTASEKNAAYFEVQASADGHQWQTIGRVEAAGTSSTPRSYALLDQNIARYGALVVYYRLRQVDADGTASFSPVRTLAPDAAAWTVTAYPNPFAQNLSAQITGSESSPVTLSLYDAAGRLVLHRQVAGNAGQQLVDLRSAVLATGAYVLHVQQGSHIGTVRLTKE
jgi:hypothetical protein